MAGSACEARGLEIRDAISVTTVPRPLRDATVKKPLLYFVCGISSITERGTEGKEKKRNLSAIFVIAISTKKNDHFSGVETRF